MIYFPVDKLIDHHLKIASENNFARLHGNLLSEEHLDSIINHPLKKSQLLEKKKHTLHYVKTFINSVGIDYG